MAKPAPMITPLASKRRQTLRDKVLPQLNLGPFVNGEFCVPDSSDLFTVIEPATNTLLAEISEASASDVSNAVTAARNAFDLGPWRRLHPRQRAAALYRLADLIEKNLDVLALLESADTGKLYAGVKSWDIPNAAKTYRYYGGWADKLSGDTLAPIGDVDVFTRKEPVGVVAAILPWNFPFACLSWKIAPALAAGCTIVIKASERAPLSSQALAGLVNEAGFPAGVINIVPGRGSTTGATLAADPRVDKITFTGSGATARAIVRAAPQFPRLTLELGGKGATVVFQDADLEGAIAGASTGIFSVAGQNCCAGSRVFVHRSIYDEFTERLVESAKEIRLGDPFDYATQQGPQIDRRHITQIDRYVREAVDGGATCRVGGKQASQGELYYLPTVMTNVRLDATISQDEVFGPVGNIYCFSDYDEVVRMANGTNYGLSASVWTASKKTARDFVKDIRVGTCWVNCFGYFDSSVPWGGIKGSGVGRELGREGIQGFVETKAIYWEDGN